MACHASLETCWIRSWACQQQRSSRASPSRKGRIWLTSAPWRSINGVTHMPSTARFCGPQTWMYQDSLVLICRKPTTSGATRKGRLRGCTAFGRKNTGISAHRSCSLKTCQCPVFNMFFWYSLNSTLNSTLSSLQ